MRSQFTVVYDACVLYPAPIRDLLMHLALSDLFRARWSDKIHDEWIRNVLINRPDLDREQLQRTRRLMNSHVRDCLVSGFDHLIPQVDIPDADDRHVVAAAIHSDASLIITFNIKDFPVNALRPFNLAAKHPDDFIVDLINLNAARVFPSVASHRQSLKKPPKSVEEYLETLQAHGLVKTALAMRHSAHEI